MSPVSKGRWLNRCPVWESGARSRAAEEAEILLWPFAPASRAAADLGERNPSSSALSWRKLTESDEVGGHGNGQQMRPPKFITYRRFLGVPPPSGPSSVSLSQARPSEKFISPQALNYHPLSNLIFNSSRISLAFTIRTPISKESNGH